MTNTFEQQCPLCENNVKYELKDHCNLKHFLCRICVEFIISVGAEKLLLESIHQWRVALSDKARGSNAEKVFVITRAPMVARQDESAHPILNAEYVERKKLPR